MFQRLLLLLLGLPAVFSCQHPRPFAEAGARETRAGVCLVVQLGGTQYHLIDKRARLLPCPGSQFRHETPLVAYRIVRHGPPLAAPPAQDDTVAVTVTPAQADRLVALAQAFFAQGRRPGGASFPDGRPAADTVALASCLRLAGAGLEGTTRVGRLDARSGDWHRAAFFRVEEGFAQLFDELPAN